MDLREAVEKAQRILFEEQTKPTRQYNYAKEIGFTRGVTNEALLGLAAHATLSSNRRDRPRTVYEDPTIYKFESVNFDLLVKIYSQVIETERPKFIGAPGKLVETPFRAA